MSATFPYTFHPQPPSHPKTTGGKHGPSVALPLTFSEDEDIKAISNHNPPVRLTTLDISSTKPKIKSSIVSVSSFPTAHNYFTAKKPGLASIQALSNNNNFAVINLNHVVPSSCLNHTSLTTIASTTTASTSPSITTFNFSNTENNIVCLATIVNNNNNTQSSSTNNNYQNSTAAVTSSSTPCSTTQLTNEQSASSTIEQISPLSTKQPSLSTYVQQSTSLVPSSTNPQITSVSHNATNDNNNTVSTLSTACNSLVNEAPAVSPTSSSDHSFGSVSNFAYEHDHDYESVGSPCSSTASGPIYVRPAGFTHHAQEIEVPNVKNKLKKKKKYHTSLITVREGSKKREATPPKLKPKREPLPMKLRALPQSFWQQPNVAHQVSPATLFLPPLLNKDSEEVMMDVRPVTPPEDKDITKKPQAPERKLIVTNTDLLFRLFDGIKEGKKPNNSFKSRAIKARKLIPRSNTKGLLLGNDPYMVDAVTEKIFPQLTLEGSRHCLGGGNTSLQLITLKEGDRTVTLPSLSLEQNYPQMLSELVSYI